MKTKTNAFHCFQRRPIFSAPSSRRTEALIFSIGLSASWARPNGIFGEFGAGGFELLVEDMVRLNNIVKEENPGHCLAGETRRGGSRLWLACSGERAPEIAESMMRMAVQLSRESMGETARTVQLWLQQAEEERIERGAMRLFDKIASSRFIPRH